MIEHMTRWGLDEKAEVRSASRRRRAERRLGRELARRDVGDTLAPLLNTPPPDWFTPEQAAAYVAEITRLFRRLAPLAHARAASA